MRIRSTRPEFWRSSTIAQLDWDVRLVLKGLESYVDDNGVGKDDIALIAADVFPRDLSANPPETLRRLTEAISTLHNGGLIARYVINRERLIYVDRWKEIQYIQKPAKGRFPRPDGTMEYREDVSPESYRKSPEDFRTKAGEQGSRGAGEQGDDEPADREPEPDFPEPTVVIDDPPEFIDAPPPARQHPSSAALTVVRQTLGNAGYPKTTIKRLAIQVGKLAHDGHPDTLIRESLTEWDRRDGPMKPEFLPTVLGDVVKRSRAAPGNTGQPTNKLRATAELAARMRAEETQAARKELA